MKEEHMSDEELEKVALETVPQGGMDKYSWFHERVHALGKLWSRRLSDRENPLSQSEFEELLSFAELDTALGTIGNAAVMGLLSQEHCKDILENEAIEEYGKTVWLKKAVQLRLDMEKVRVSEDPAIRQELLDVMLFQSQRWPILEVLKDLDGEELNYCERRLENRSVLTRRSREFVRQKIRKERKSRK